MPKGRTLIAKSKKPTRITEERNPESARIDTLDAMGILRTIQSQDALVPVAVWQELPNIAKAVDAVVKAFQRGGRLIYVGAGTSGRIAVLDAAECPPTFGTPPEMVQAVIAGGARALTHAVEGAEDDGTQGRLDLVARKISSRDVVVGIAASGTTPYTLGAIIYARSRRATTVGITSNPDSPLSLKAHIAIVPKTGPEIVTGSTRMKAGLAQKMILHMISTASMIRIGNVYRNYMVGVRPTNAKLWERACSIIEKITGVDREAAEGALKASGKDVKLAIVMLRTGFSRTRAAQLLKQKGRNLRALE